jgi:hypothetical protein
MEVSVGKILVQVLSSVNIFTMGTFTKRRDFDGAIEHCKTGFGVA